MKLKVCGMKDAENIQQLAALQPDWMGMIFYAGSPRYPKNLQPADLQNVAISKVGVFVNASIEDMRQAVAKWSLSYVQLHGDETVEQVKQLNHAGFRVIKVFRVVDQLPSDLIEFAPFVDMFLFDTKKAKAYGGTGEKFDWNLLLDYPLDVPYLLSGGVGLDDLEQIKNMDLPGCIGIDINSKVEVKPGFKDLEKIKKIKEKL